MSIRKIKKGKSLAWAFSIVSFLCIFSVFSCDNDFGDYDLDDTGYGSAIQDDYDAEELAKDLHEAVKDAVGTLGEGTYTDEVVAGSSGTASLTGTKSSNTSYFGDSMSTTDDYDFVIVFSDYTDLGCTITGTVDYDYYRYQSTNGSTGTSSFSYNISLSGTSVTVDSGSLSDTIGISVFDDDSNSHFIGTVSAGGSSYTVDYYIF